MGVFGGRVRSIWRENEGYLEGERGVLGEK